MHEHGHNGAMMSAIMGLISIVNYLFSQIQINIYSWQIPPFLLQSIALIAGVISITSGIISIRKNTKK